MDLGYLLYVQRKVHYVPAVGYSVPPVLLIIVDGKMK